MDNEIYYFESDTLNPYENIAFEKAMFDQCTSNALYLWVNGPSVIAGINQNIEKEFNAEAKDKYNVNLVRRLTGGGCVYHDEGNLNFTFIIPGEVTDFTRQLDVVVNALAKLGVEASPSGRNDIVADGKKISGTAWLLEDNKTMFHGTLLVDVNVEQMVEVLTPSYKKFEGKGIDSVKARVANLVDINPDITISALKKELLQSFEEEFGTKAIVGQGVNRDLDLENKLKSEDFIFSKNMESTVEHEERIANSLYTISLKLVGGVIKHASVYSDDLDLSRTNKLEAYLLDKPYSSYTELIKNFKDMD